jgi:hypothetical protein
MTLNTTEPKFCSLASKGSAEEIYVRVFLGIHRRYCILLLTN